MGKHFAGLGKLSQKYESNQRLGAIGFDKTGGFSYGLYQIASRVGTMAKFLKWLSGRFPDAWAVLKDAGGNDAATRGKASFKSAWRFLGRSRKDWAAIQHFYIQQTHYDPLVADLLRGGLDVNSRSNALKDVVWSTAVQHGPNTNVVRLAYQRCVDRSDDASLIAEIYKERRGRFGSSTRKVRKSVMSRFDRELAEALEMLKADDSSVDDSKVELALPVVEASAGSGKGFFDKSKMRNL